ncbi:hypothetical protein MAR_021373 [Mya arenaria]|uniref:Uncharacterized protein n=1 Tax=Mya arenaria TaxID=6604 RepID=A0ABY7EC67_MYAAR|nr:hypothetical protein MAR_021373 [Mya arenaria]
MANKRGASTADTPQQIIQDISVYCTQYRASTEKTFNGLLNAYRQECLTKNLCGQINNFFCGLRLLVAIADVCEASTSIFENNYESGDLGSAIDPHLNRYRKAECGTLR